MDFYKQWLGIPDGPRPPDHYELLRVVRFEDDAEKIRAHYKKLNAHVRKYATGQYMLQSQDMLNEMARAMLCLTDLERKRDYDESLGREFAPETDEYGRQPLLDVLTRQGDISRDQKREVEDYAKRRGLNPQDAIVQMKLVSPEKASQALSKQLGYSYVDLEDMIPEDDILDGVPRDLVKRNSFIPLFIDDGRLLIACLDQPEHELEDELRLRYDVPVRPVITTLKAINQAITQHYAPGMRDEAKTVTPRSSGGTAKGSTSSSSEKAAPKAAAKKAASKHVTFADLSPNEQKERKQWGYVMMGQSFLLPILIPQILPMIFASLTNRMPSFPMCLLASLILCGSVSWWVTQKYWK
ncbi:MAG: hypothetical protein R3C18_23855 [Planctomycetaceae bacterium]